MIQGYNPRTGEPAGEPVPETTDAEVGAIAEAAAGALDAWEGMGPGGRAAALEAVAGARDELIPLADTETALGVARLTGELARTTGQLRMFAGVLRDGAFLDLAVPRPARACPSCAGSAGPSARSRCSPPPTSRSRSRWPAAPPQQHWPRAARSSSRRTRRIRGPPR